MKEIRSTPVEYVSLKHGPVSKAVHEEGAAIRALQSSVQGEIFSNEPKPPMKPNRVRQSINLHGGKGFDGLTGFYNGTYYDKGTPKLPKK